jgi:isoleucyl-tRNA synthetase
VSDADLLEIDRWALAELARLTDEVTRAYESYSFHRVYHLVHNFCVVEMSSFYLDILKDRLYCEGRDSRERRAAQTVLQRILTTLVRLLAPVLVNTSEEVWALLGAGKTTLSVHLAPWPEVDEAHVDDALAARWERMISVRGQVLKSLEGLRAAKVIGSSLEAAVTLYTEDEELYRFVKSFEKDLTTIFITSEASIELGQSSDAVQSTEIPALHVHAVPSKHAKCKRCWNLRPTVGAIAAHPDLCGRCAKAVDNS